MNFDINDAFGNKIGSIRHSPDLADALGEYLAARALVKAQRNSHSIIKVLEFANRIYDELSFLLNQFDELANKQSGIDTTSAKRYLLERGQEWNEANLAIHENKLSENGKKLESYMQKTLIPLSEKLGSCLVESQEVLRVMFGIDYIYEKTFELLFVYNNESIDRLEARGFVDFEIENQIFKTVQKNYFQATEPVMKMHNDVLTMINEYNNSFSETELLADFYDLEKTLDQFEDAFKKAYVAIQAREEVALKVLDIQIKEGS